MLCAHSLLSLCCDILRASKSRKCSQNSQERPPRLLFSLWKSKERERGAHTGPTPNARLNSGWAARPPRNNLRENLSCSRDFLDSRWNLGAPAAPCGRRGEGIASLLMWKLWVCSAPQVLLPGGGSGGRSSLSSLPPLSTLRNSHFSSGNVRLQAARTARLSPPRPRPAPPNPRAAFLTIPAGLTFPSINQPRYWRGE